MQKLRRVGTSPVPGVNAFTFITPRKRRNTERGPEAGVRGASPGVWDRRKGGGMYAYTEGVYPL